MKFIDDLYNLYRDHLSGDDEDAIALVLGVLQEQDRKDMINLIKDMNDDEIFQMLSMFLIELLRQKMATEDGDGDTLHSHPSDTFH